MLSHRVQNKLGFFFGSSLILGCQPAEPQAQSLAWLPLVCVVLAAFGWAGIACYGSWRLLRREGSDSVQWLGPLLGWGTGVAVLLLAYWIAATNPSATIPRAIDDTNAPNAANLRVADAKYGGPYTYKGGTSKLINFEIYQHYGLSYSDCRELSLALLRQSVEENRSNVNGDLFQRYNYVIRDDDKIYVAVWKGEPIDETKAVWLTAKAFTPPKDVMINFYPEDPFPKLGHSASSPGYIAVPSTTGFQRIGILDAMSKHFMIVRGPGVDVTNFEARVWPLATVGYAGEIIVDVKKGNYTLNSGSGTYQPDGDRLVEVAERFTEVLDGNPPAYLYDDYKKTLRSFQPISKLKRLWPQPQG